MQLFPFHNKTLSPEKQGQGNTCNYRTNSRARHSSRAETVRFRGWMGPAEAQLTCSPERQGSFGDEGGRDTSRTARGNPKAVALKGAAHALGYVSLHSPPSPLPPTYSYVLSIYTQLVSSSAGFPGAVNEQKPGLYDHNNRLSFFCLLSSPP